MQYDSIGNQRDRGRSKKKSKHFKGDKKSQSRSQSGIHVCKYCGSNHQWRQCPAYGETWKLCGKKNHFAKKCHSRKQGQITSSAKHKSFKYCKVNLDQESSDNGQTDEITSKVKSMYYHYVHFNSVNTRMHINLSTKSCNGSSIKTHFKVNTGADGNLLPLGDFFKHFPEANLNNLAKRVDPHTKLYAHDNTEIKQLGVCELLVEYKMNKKIYEFYVADFSTAILGIHDPESLRLVTVHFNSIDTEIPQAESSLKELLSTGSTPMCVNAIQGADNEFSIKIKCDYSDFFTGIGNVNTTIDIKLKNGAVPCVASIHRVAHALQEPLRLKLEKLCDEGILRKLKID